MEAADRTLLIVGTCGAIVAAGFGALAGSGLRLASPLVAPGDDERVVIGTQEVFTDGAPAYPTWAPEPLYPGSEPDPMAEYSAAWDAAMTDRRDPGPVALRPPEDLPPPYEVRMEGEARAQRQAESGPRVVRVSPPSDGRYAYGEPARPQPPVDGDKPKA